MNKNYLLTTINRTRIFSILLFTCLTVISAINVQAQSDEPIQVKATAQGGILDVLERQKKAIVGSWLVDVTVLGLPPNCGCATTKNLGTFTEEGGFIGAAPVDSRQSFTSPGHGTWTYQGGRSFGLTFLALIYQPDGTLTGIFKLNGTATLDESGEKLSGPSKGIITDLAGHVLFQYEATVQGARIKVE
jgi:hypothetical protein